MKLNDKDINKLPDDGYVIFPLSMSRLQTSQSPQKCIEFISNLDLKVNLPTNDIIFLYTNGLYFNSNENASNLREKTNSQMLSHCYALKKLIKKKKYFPRGFHFLPFDYIILNSPYFQKFFDILKTEYKKNSNFKQIILKNLKNKNYINASINFIFEEIVVSHIIREKLIEFPKTLVKNDTYRLIVYPGEIFEIEAYIWNNKILPQKNPKTLGRYYKSTYNPLTNELYSFSEYILF